MEVTASIASSFEPFDRDKVWVFCDLEPWGAMFEDGVRNNPGAAKSLAFLLYALILEVLS